MSLLSKIIFATLAVLMISSSSIILPSYALTFPFSLPARPDPPTGFKATVLSSHSIQLSWNVVPAATSYHIYRSTYLGGFTQIGTSTGPSYLDQTVGLVPNVNTYYYEVSSYNANGGGSATPAVSANMFSTTPTTTTPTTTTPTTTTPTTTAKPAGSACTLNSQCQSGVCSSTNICLAPATAPTITTATTPTAPTTTSPNPACLAVKTILTNSGYSTIVITTVMTAMKCS